MSDEQPQGQETQKPPKRYWEAKEQFFDLKASHWVQIVLTIVLGCIAYAQYTVYSRQAGIMDEQTNISKRQLGLTEIVQRPWIAPIGLPKSLLISFSLILAEHSASKWQSRTLAPF